MYKIKCKTRLGGIANNNRNTKQQQQIKLAKTVKQRRFVGAGTPPEMLTIFSGNKNKYLNSVIFQNLVEQTLTTHYFADFGCLGVLKTDPAYILHHNRYGKT